jgi:tetratricopeptide (TPR) repeat protein
VTSRRFWSIAATAFVLTALVAPPSSRAETATVEPAAPAEHLDPIEHAWRAPANRLEDRVTRTRRASLELGVWNLDAAARALMAAGSEGDALERAHAAVRLAPDLPAGRMLLAKALWLNGRGAIAAIRTAFSALAAIPRHLEASLWFGGTLMFVLSLSLVVAGMWCITLIGGAVLPHAAHDLGDLLSGSMPGFARVAFLASLLLVPLALGEGVLGLCAALMAVGVVYGDLRQRLTLFLAALVMILGAFPAIQLAGSTLNAFSADPVAEAAFSTAQGFTHPVNQMRIEAAADSDPLAAQALALQARRTGSLAGADAYYQELLHRAPNDPVVANNAANVRFNLGHIESALILYKRSVELRPDPVVLFNLSQAHGRAFQVSDLSRTLAEAQKLNGDLVAELTALQGAEPVGFVVDLPIDTRQIWRRILRSDQGESVAREIRGSFAPGRLGRDSLLAAGVFCGVLAVFTLLGSRMYRSRDCSRCGGRICQRCDPETGGGAICSGCKQLFQQSETTDRELRLVRIGELRHREERRERYAVVAAFLVPGSAGLLAKRPLSCLLGSLFAVSALLAFCWHDGVVPDPLVAGGAASFASLCLAGLAILAYMVVVLSALASPRNA